MSALHAGAGTGTDESGLRERHPHWVYAALAALEVTTALLTLLLASRFLRYHEEAVQSQEVWSMRLGRISRLAKLAAETNAPGNDVFESRAVGEEEARVEERHALFTRTMATLREELGRDGSLVPVPRLIEQLASADQHAAQMVRDEQALFRSFAAGDVGEAAERMSIMDRRHAALQATLVDAADTAQRLQAERLLERTRTVSVLVGWSYGVVAVMLFLALAVMVWGVLAARRTLALARDKEAYLAEIEYSETRFRSLSAAAPFGLLEVDPAEVCTYANRRWCQLSGLDLIETLGSGWTRAIHPDDRERVFAALRAGGAEAALPLECRLRPTSGEDRWVEINAVDVGPGGARRRDRILAVNDVTARRRAEDTLREANQELRGWAETTERRSREVSALSQMGELLQSCMAEEEVLDVVTLKVPAVLPASSGALYLSDRAADRTAERGAALVRRAAWGDALPQATLIEAGACWAVRRGRIHSTGGGEPSVMCPHAADAEGRPTLCVPMTVQGDPIGVLHVRGQIGAMELDRQLAGAAAEQAALLVANLRLRERLRAESIRDALTGLHNRRFLDETVGQDLARAARQGERLGFLLADIDHFKRLNDTRGHEAGDEALRAVGAFLRTRIRAQDRAFRYGGEEFLLVLADATAEEFAVVAEDLRQGVESLAFKLRGERVGPVTASFGLAVYPDHGQTVDELLRLADAALYRAKHEGRNRVVVAERASS